MPDSTNPAPRVNLAAIMRRQCGLSSQEAQPVTKEGVLVATMRKQIAAAHPTSRADALDGGHRRTAFGE